MRSVSVAEGPALISKFRYILLDVDGVVWQGSEPIAGVPAALSRLHASGVTMRFVTNNASLTREAVAAKFGRMGMCFVTTDMIYSSSFAAAHVLKQMQLARPNVWVVGEEGLHRELALELPPSSRTRGLKVRLGEGGYNPPTMARALTTPLLYCDGNPEPVSVTDLAIGAVVVGMDYAFDMVKMAVATLALQHEGTVFVATNVDPQYPADGGVLLPGTGSLISALATAAGRPPDVICGKPNVTLAEVLRVREGVTDPSQCLMIGDRVTDIIFGRQAGFATMLVLSGCDGLADVEKAGMEGIPDYICDSVVLLSPE